jgi:hypothetical protein
MKKVEMVKAEAIIDVKIGSQFLQDLQAVVLYLTSLEPAGKLQQVVNKANNNEEMDPWEKSMYTMLVLITTVEENARTAGFTNIEEIPEEEISPEEPES